MSSHNTQTRDMPVLNSVWRIFLHFPKYVANNFGVFRGCWASDDSDVGELWPGEGVVEVVFQEVVLRKVRKIALLY